MKEQTTKVRTAIALVRSMDKAEQFAFFRHCVEQEPGFAEYDDYRCQMAQAKAAAERRARGLSGIDDDGMFLLSDEERRAAALKVIK